jgi:hypothetical protein
MTVAPLRHRWHGCPFGDSNRRTKESGWESMNAQSCAWQRAFEAANRSLIVEERSDDAGGSSLE